MIIGLDNIIKWTEENNGTYWYIKSGLGEKANLFFSATSGDDQTLSLSDSMVKLRKCLGMLAPGNYAIQCWQTAGQKKSWNSSNFQITNSDGSTPSQISGTQYQQFSGMPQKSISEMIEEALQKERTINKIERLEADLKLKEARIKELESDLESTSHKIGSSFSRLVEQFAPNLLQEGHPVKISGADDQEKLGNLLEEWSKLEPDLIGTIEKVVNLAKTKPGKYSLAKTMM